MTAIFLDESGCLGFELQKKATSRNFIITFLSSSKPNLPDKIVRQVFKSIASARRETHCGTLHCVHEHQKVRQKMFSILQDDKSDLKIMTIRLCKEQTDRNWFLDKDWLYNNMTSVLLDRVIERKLIEGNRVNLIASRRGTSKFAQKNFVEYLSSQMLKHKIILKTEIKAPAECKGLQIVDFVAWAMFQKYEHQESIYYDAIRDLVVEEGNYLEGKSAKNLRNTYQVI